MKQIPPAVQDDYRYLEFKVNGERKNIGEVVDAVWGSALKYMGAEGVSNADIWIIGNKFDEKEQTVVIKVKDSSEDSLRAALTLNNGFEDDSFLSIQNVSGSISGLK